MSRMARFSVAPTELDEVLGPAWLAAMLYGDHPGVEVAEVVVVETQVTAATKVRVALELRDPSPGLETEICIKGYFGEASRRFLQSNSARHETWFYDRIAPQLPGCGLPPCLYAAVDEATNHGLIIMRDMAAAGGTFLSSLTPYSVEEAYNGVEKLARMHAAGWQGTALCALPWLEPRLEQFARDSMIPVETLHALLNGPRGDPLPAAIRDGHRLHRALGLLVLKLGGDPRCLVHGDAHAGNLYRLPGDRLEMGIIDWQLVQQGHWAQDVAYHLGAALVPELRRTHERALLDHYRAALESFGGPAIAADLAWDRYRAAMLYGYYLWGLTRVVGPEITHEFVRRLGLAVVELESFRLVEG